MQFAAVEYGSNLVGTQQQQQQSSDAAQQQGQATVPAACEPQDSIVDDPTDVVMVLYVLFWVVGFTVGAAVAGIPSGSSMLQQQLTAGAMGLSSTVASELNVEWQKHMPLVAVCHSVVTSFYSL